MGRASIKTLPERLILASEALRRSNEIRQKQLISFENAGDILKCARAIEEAVEKAERYVEISCLEISFDSIHLAVLIEQLETAGYKTEIVNSRTRHLRISW